MKVTFLGTAASEGFPSLFCLCPPCVEARARGGRDLRARASVGVDDDVIIDLGPDIYGHTLNRGLDLSRLRTIVLTHAHSDHCAIADLNRIFGQNAMGRDGVTVDLIANRSVLDRIDGEKNARDRRYALHEAVPGTTVAIGGGSVHLIEANHDPGQVCVLPVIERDGRSVFYATDTAAYTPAMWAQLEAWGGVLDLVIMDCTKVDMGRDSALHVPPDPTVFGGHMGMTENLAVREGLLARGLATERTQFVSTHFAHMFGPLHERLEAVFAGTGIRPAYDGLTLTV